MTDPAAAAPPQGETPPADPNATPPATPPAAGATPPATPPEPSTVLGADPKDPPAAEAWSADWRQKYAGEDEKLLARLNRYQSPKAVVDALVAAQNRIAAGEVKPPLPDNATPEQLTAWRKDHGIPETADGYFEKLPDGLVIGDDDKAIFKDFASKMHSLNVDPKVMHEVVRWYDGFAEAQIADRAEQDNAAKTAAEDALRPEWGADYRANVNLINGLLGSAPEGVKEAVLAARAADGTALGNNPNVLRWLAGLAREMNPAATLVPAGGTAGAGVDDEIANIEKVMRENRPAYVRDEKMQSRLRDLYAAREKLKGRAA